MNIFRNENFPFSWSNVEIGHKRGCYGDLFFVLLQRSRSTSSSFFAAERRRSVQHGHKVGVYSTVYNRVRSYHENPKMLICLSGSERNKISRNTLRSLLLLRWTSKTSSRTSSSAVNGIWRRYKATNTAAYQLIVGGRGRTWTRLSQD